MNMLPKTGETWAPALPWPIDECPAGFYTHGYSRALVGGKAGYAWPVVIDEVGAMHVYAHRPDGTPVTIYLRDMRLGWQRIEG